MSQHRIRFTVEGPIGRFDEVEKWLIEGGYTLSNVDLIKNGQRKSTKGFKHKHYKKPAVEMVYDTLNGNKGMVFDFGQLHKALDMPSGTLSGSLAKLKKEGRAKNDGKGRWTVVK